MLFKGNIEPKIPKCQTKLKVAIDKKLDEEAKALRLFHKKLNQVMFDISKN